MIEQLINEKYRFKVTGLSRISEGVGGLTYLVDTNTGKYVLKGIQGDDIYVLNEPEIAIFLKERGIPVAEYVSTKDNLYLWQHDGIVYQMQRYVEGGILQFHKAPDWFMDESARLLGRIHAALSEFRRLPEGMGSGFISFMRSGSAKASYEETFEKTRSLQDAGIADDIQYRLSLVDRLQTVEFDLAKFTCVNTHGDYKISQIICRDGHIEAVIDWSAACVHPICWEIIRSFTYADPGCENGAIDTDRFIGYVKRYLRYFTLNAYDLQMMPYFFFHQLLACDYYGQYYASEDRNRDDFLFQARFATKLIRWFESNAMDLSTRLRDECEVSA